MGIQTSLRCPHGKFVLNRTEEDRHRLAANGKMIVPAAQGSPTHMFCIENFDRRRCGGDVSADVLLCFNSLKKPKKNFFISFVVSVLLIIAIEKAASQPLCSYCHKNIVHSRLNGSGFQPQGESSVAYVRINTDPFATHPNDLVGSLL